MRSLQIGLVFTLITTVTLGLASPLLNFTQEAINNTPTLAATPVAKADRNTP
jgi:hypothetical protein